MERGEPGTLSPPPGGFAARLAELDAELAALRGPSWREQLTLVAVSKMAEPAAVREAFAAGQLDFGENRVQELLRKQEALADLPVRWHFIGHLQTNKVKQLVGKVEMIQSLDSVRLAEAIGRECVKRSVTCRVLVEVKTSGEEAKTGAEPGEAEELVRQCLEMDRLVVDGLMTMAPAGGDLEGARASFRALRALHERLRATPGLGYRGTALSMGMSGDYREAVAEGSTMIRIGTRLFG